MNGVEEAVGKLTSEVSKCRTDIQALKKADDEMHGTITQLSESVAEIKAVRSSNRWIIGILAVSVMSAAGYLTYTAISDHQRTDQNQRDVSTAAATAKSLDESLGKEVEERRDLENDHTKLKTSYDAHVERQDERWESVQKELGDLNEGFRWLRRRSR